MSASLGPVAAADFAADRLAELSNPEDAAPMAAYMKTNMPFYGAKKPVRTAVLRALRPHLCVESPTEYEAYVEEFWRRPHREEKYLGLAIARRYLAVAGPEQYPLFRRLIVEGAWWDFVDDIATHMVGPLARRYPDELWPVVDAWVASDHLWLRRTAMLSQVGAKDETDDDRLFAHALRLAPESEFFIRKAIGWALRDRSYTNPDGINTFLDRHWDELSGLTRREAARALVRNGLRD